MKIPLEDQIAAVEQAKAYVLDNRRDAPIPSWTVQYALDAAVATLRQALNASRACAIAEPPTSGEGVNPEREPT